MSMLHETAATHQRFLEKQHTRRRHALRSNFPVAGSHFPTSARSKRGMYG